MRANAEGVKSRFAPMKHSSGISLRLNCYLFFQEDPTFTCICTGTWVAPSKICVTTVNMRNVFCYNIYEYAHCPQQLLLTSSSGQLTIKVSSAACTV